MPSEAPMSRRRRGLRTLAILIPGILMAAGAVVWLIRDMPRRKVVSTLEARIGAEVSLGALSIVGPRDYILRDLTIRRMAGQPRLGRLHIDTLDVRGALFDVMDG